MAQATYNTSTADFDAAETGMVGFGIISDVNATYVPLIDLTVLEVPTPRRVPLVQLRLGGALMRAMLENWDGMAQNTVESGVPDVALAALPTQMRLTMIPAFSSQPLWPGNNSGTTYELSVANQSGDGARDSDTLDVICLDPAYAGSSPGCPTVKAWCEAMGGTYTGL